MRRRVALWSVLCVVLACDAESHEPGNTTPEGETERSKKEPPSEGITVEWLE